MELFIEICFACALAMMILVLIKEFLGSALLDDEAPEEESGEERSEDGEGAKKEEKGAGEDRAPREGQKKEGRRDEPAKKTETERVCVCA